MVAFRSLGGEGRLFPVSKFHIMQHTCSSRFPPTSFFFFAAVLFRPLCSFWKSHDPCRERTDWDTRVRLDGNHSGLFGQVPKISGLIDQ
jgi:hypothetical protein